MESGAAAVVSLTAFVVGCLLVWLRAAPRVVVVLAFIAGLLVNGRVERWIVWALNWVAGQVARGLAWAVDAPAEPVKAAVPGIVGIALVVVVYIQARPKKGKPNEFTAVAALLLPLLWVSMTTTIGQMQAGTGA